jgi:tight adherence protein C
MQTVALILVIILLAAAASLVVIGLRQSSGRDPLGERLAEYAERGEVTSLEEIELSQPFVERVIVPLAQGFGEFAIRFTPQNAIYETERKLEQADAPRWLNPTLFLASRIMFALVLGGAAILLLGLASSVSLLSPMGLGLTGLLVMAGFLLPNSVVSRRIRARQKEVLNSMPDALDLLTICVEAGLGFDAAMSKVIEKWDNALSLAFSRVLQEIQLGKLRREALRDMSDRLGVPEMESFVAAVIQSEQLGVSMSRVLRVQSDSMRVKRRQRAEENAQRAPVKMLLPMAFLIFPTIVIVLLGPAILNIMRTGLF